MIPCSMDCIYQTEGYCALSGGARVTNTVSSCPHYVGRRQDKNEMLNNQIDGLADGAHINKLDGGGDLRAH